MIFHCGPEKQGLLVSAGGADPEKVQLMRSDLKTGGRFDLGGESGEEREFGVNDGLAVDAGQVRVRIRFVAVVAVAAVGRADFQNFTEFLEQVHGFVDCGEAGRGEMNPDLFVNLFDAGMIVPVQKNPENRDSLRGYATVAFAQLGEDVV